MTNDRPHYVIAIMRFFLHECNQFSTKFKITLSIHMQVSRAIAKICADEVTRVTVYIQFDLTDRDEPSKFTAT